MRDLALALPRNVIAHRDELEGGRVSHGYVAFSDFKGFTSLTEGLKVLGKEGAAVIANKIDELILPIARAAVIHGGNIIAVEGDALLVSFESKKDLFSYCAASREFARRRIGTKIGSFDVSLDIGIGSGLIYEVVVGDDSRRAYVVAGEAIDKAYAIEKLSDCDIIADAPYIEAERVEKDGIVGYRLGFGRIEPIESPRTALKEDEYSLSFAPHQVRGGSFNEFLPVTAAFCDLDLISSLIGTGSLSRSRDAINELFMDAYRIIERSDGGTIDKFKGYNSLFLFGAPVVHVDDTRRALESVSELRRSADRIAKKYGLSGERGRIGLNKGVVYSGEVCGRYTVMGDGINTAARIKEAGDGEILISGAVKDELPHPECTDLGLLSFKGKDEKVRVYSFSSFGRQGEESFVLRKKELESLLGQIRGLRGEAGETIAVVGGVGSGKDKLLSRLHAALGPAGMDSFDFRPTPLHKTDPYRTAIELAKKAGGFDSDEDLLASCGGKIGDPPTMEGIERLILGCRSVMIISNGDNIDRESIALIGRMQERIRQSGAILVVSSSEKLIHGGRMMELSDLGMDDALEFASHLAESIHGTRRFRSDTAHQLIVKSKGNPLFIAELVKSARKSDEGLYFDAEIPEKLEQLLLTNVTKLPLELRLTLKLYSLMYGVDERIIRRFGMGDETERLIKAGVLSDGYEFSNDLLRKVVADQIPGPDRREYYTRIAIVTEDIFQGDNLSLSHYFSSADTTKPEIRARAVRYLDLYLKGLGDLSVVRVDRFERIIALADRNDPEERRMLVDALLGMCKFKHVNATRMEDYEEYHRISEEAAGISRGEPYEYKALLEKGRALCWMKRYDEGFEILEQARLMAWENGDLPAFGNISSIYAYALSYRAGRPKEALVILEEAERAVVEEIRKRGDIDHDFGYALSTLYFTTAECHNKDGRPDVALVYLNRAKYYAEQFSIHHILVQSLGTIGESYYNLGRYKLAEESCLLADHVIDRNRIQMRYFKKDLYALLSMIYGKMGNEGRRTAFLALSESL
ncbi:MAG: adenylate/guanylate cyclase domain-containing protein [Candidatus Micrarchaeia archaeon]